MGLLRRSPILSDRGPKLTPVERDTARRRAQRAAWAARTSVTMTARRAYRDYRATAGDRFMAWPLWERHYREAYRGGAAHSSGEQFSSWDD
ncbi:hypothetical protein ACWDPV_10910 [Gordonia sp. NPDC003504]